MIAGDDPFNLTLGLFVHRARLRLIVDHRNHISRGPGIQRTKILLHGMKREVALQILGHIVPVANALQGADHFKADPVEQNAGADCRATREKRPAGFVTQDDHRPFLRIVHIVQPPALVHRQVANLIEHGRDAHDLAAGLVKVTDCAEVTSSNDRSRSRHAGAFAHDIFVIAVIQIILAQSREAALHYGRPG